MARSSAPSRLRRTSASCRGLAWPGTRPSRRERWRYHDERFLGVGSQVSRGSRGGRRLRTRPARQGMRHRRTHRTAGRVAGGALVSSRARGCRFATVLVTATIWGSWAAITPAQQAPAIERARALYDAGRLIEARTLLEDLVRAQPGDAGAYLLLGVIERTT